ncbi:MAG: substrate-binding domain-containing protein [Ignavibacteriales bacterium]|nr:substrate-binding domain-containing protein [Ignavibacteriales bacterium]
MKPAILFSVIVVFSLAGCTMRQGSDIRNGTLHVLATESHLPLVQQLVNDYQSIYPGVSLTVGGATTRGAIVELVNDSVHCIMVDRRLNDEERRVAHDAKLIIGESEVARDALVVLVHPQNKLASLSTSELGSILSGQTTLWSKFPGSKLHGVIELCLTGRNSGLYEMVTHRFFSIQNDVPLAAVAASQDSVLHYVAANPEALGVISFAVWKDTTLEASQRWKKNIRALDLLGKNEDGAVTAVKATQRSIYDQVYPLTYSLYIYTSEKTPGTAYGFSAFVSEDIGQRVFLYAGLVPKTMPYRTIQLTQE